MTCTVAIPAKDVFTAAEVRDLVGWAYECGRHDEWLRGFPPEPDPTMDDVKALEAIYEAHTGSGNRA